VKLGSPTTVIAATEPAFDLGYESIDHPKKTNVALVSTEPVSDTFDHLLALGRSFGLRRGYG